MKTAQQWLDSEQWHETSDRDILKQITAIQLDALREALALALAMVWGAHAQMDEAVGTKQEIISNLEKLIDELERKTAAR